MNFYNKKVTLHIRIIKVLTMMIYILILKCNKVRKFHKIDRS